MAPHRQAPLLLDRSAGTARTSDGHWMIPLGRLYLVTFLCGASVMTLELTGSRILAPFLGSSVYVWTSLIGVILAALSYGYYWGGKLADASPTAERFSRLIFGAAVTTSIVIPVQYPLLVVLGKGYLDLRLAAVVATAVLFAIPAVLLGTVTPFALRLSLHSIEHSGEAAGRLYALSTLGSILGTFISGFFLIAVLGTLQMVAVTALVLLVCSALAAPRDKLVAKVLFLLLLALIGYLSHKTTGVLAAAGLIDIDTAQQRVLVLDTIKQPKNLKIRTLITDPLGFQSAMSIEEPLRLVAKYTRFYELSFTFTPGLRRALMLGGGAYSYPKHFIARHAPAEMIVVELDPGMTEIARRYFHLKDDPRLRIIHQDARVFLNNSSERFDAIYLDVFGAAPAVPFQLVTIEAVQRMHEQLTPEGAVYFNLISGIEGPEGKFLRACLRTFKTVFPQVELFVGDPTKETNYPQNLVMVAFKTPREDLSAGADEQAARLLEKRWRVAIAEDMPVLRDAYAPVEQYLLPATARMEQRLRLPIPQDGL